MSRRPCDDSVDDQAHPIQDPPRHGEALLGLGGYCGIFHSCSKQRLMDLRFRCATTHADPGRELQHERPGPWLSTASAATACYGGLLAAGKTEVSCHDV